MESNLSLYKIFYTTAKTQNISKASKELFISQPAISKAIQKLEQNLGTSLFNRSSRGVTLTKEGLILFNHIQSAFRSVELGEDAVRREIAGASGTLHIGVSTTLCKHLLLPYLKDFISENPSIRISISCQSSSHTLQMLDENQLDLGLIGTHNKDLHQTYYPIGQIHDIFVSTRDYYANLNLPKNALASSVFRTATIMLLDQENTSRKYIDDYMIMNQIETHNILEVSDMDLLIEFSKIGMGVGCVIREFVKEELSSGSLIEIPLDIPIHTREVGFVYNKTAAMPGALQRFLYYLSQK